ncbi:ABC-2 type transport system permease protein [Actinopolyspora xinjiangensis]|uniref:ABC-2 type transport system permease protein n=1 Tax=Actinopolyspora xinjiangensis TaxID=405564 RepID=A0A1H0VRE8_9ACTN|nr:ABC transporter permease [Actinopolyspora xinjiangensis]SDP80934.1 ABC-2 type transport system permease protein [Actinopolyspora xinjiangensis]
MTLLAVERMKLFTTRSPWWCMIVALALTVGFGALYAATLPAEFTFDVAATQSGGQLGMMVIMVLAALAVTTEYRFGTIKATFQAAPNRTAVMLAKSTVVTALAFVVGEIAAFAAWGVSYLISGNEVLALDTSQEWVQLTGLGLVYAGAALYALAVGMLVRQSAGAISLVLVWALLVESLVQLLPRVGNDLYDWMPFAAATRFLMQSGGAETSMSSQLPEPPIGPWASLVYFLAIGVVLLVLGIVTVRQRDA